MTAYVVMDDGPVQDEELTIENVIDVDFEKNAKAYVFIGTQMEDGVELRYKKLISADRIRMVTIIESPEEAVEEENDKKD